MLNAMITNNTTDELKHIIEQEELKH